MATYTLAQLVAPQQLGNADASLYQVSANQTVKIGRAVFCNTTAGAVTLTAGVTSGAALSASTTFISARTLAPGETYVSPELSGMVLPASWTIRAYSGTAAAVSVEISGLVVS